MKTIKTIITVCAIALISFSGFSKKPKNVKSNNFKFTYEVEIPQIDGTHNLFELWIPMPQSDNYQEINDIKIKSDFKYSIKKEKHFKNEYIYLRTNASKGGSISINVQASRFERNGGEYTELKNAEMYLGETKKVLMTDEIRKETQEVIKDVNGKFNQAKAIYDHIVSTLKYDKSGKGWGNGDVLFVCDERRGNCTDFHSLFIAMCRSIDIPARFAMGFPLPEDIDESVIKGYHCWAEFYIDGKGWIPVDASEAFNHPDKKEYLFGNLDYNRIQFTMGRDIEVKGKDDLHSLNFFIYPYCLVNHKEYKIVKKFYYAKTDNE